MQTKILKKKKKDNVMSTLMEANNYLFTNEGEVLKLQMHQPRKFLR